MAILFKDEIFLAHETGAHPECPARLRAIYERLERDGLTGRFAQGAIRTATLAELSRVHREAYVRQIEQYAQQGGGHIEADTIMSPQSFDVACKAAGTAIDGC